MDGKTRKAFESGLKRFDGLYRRLAGIDGNVEKMAGAVRDMMDASVSDFIKGSRKDLDEVKDQMQKDMDEFVDSVKGKSVLRNVKRKVRRVKRSVARSLRRRSL